jgi:hypothetical protein
VPRAAATLAVLALLAAGCGGGDDVEERAAPDRSIPEECREESRQFDREVQSRDARVPEGRCAGLAQPIGPLAQ